MALRSWCAILAFNLMVPVFSWGQTPFNHLDANGDGYLSPQEFKGPPMAFNRLDRNHDGRISFDEAEGSPLREQKGGPREQLQTTPQSKTGRQEASASATAAATRPLIFIDTHNHLVGKAGPGARRSGGEGPAEMALRSMNANGIKLSLIMPMPQGTEQPHRLYVDDILPYVQQYPDRFAVLGGGDTLNVTIQESVKSGQLTDQMIRRFDSDADALVKKGIVGFGEMTAEHVSMRSDHPYVAAAPDHTLFLRLADLAAKHNLPIDFHMESVPEDMPLPAHLDQANNPKVLKANIPAFERLLDHNPKANIVWVHMGWDNTGKRTVAQTRQLLGKHPNLYVSLRVASGMQAKRIERATFPLDDQGRLKADWLALFKEFPDRFLIGSDEIIKSGDDHPSADSITSTMSMIRQLPEDLQKAIGIDNPQRLYRLKK